MKKKTLIAEKQPSSPIHWTANVSCWFSVLTTLAFLFQWLIQWIWYWYGLLSPLARFLQQFSEPMPWPFLFFPLLSQLAFVLILLIFGGIALALSFRRQWRKGLGRAIIGVALPGIILMFYAAFYTYEMLCCMS